MTIEPRIPPRRVSAKSNTQNYVDMFATMRPSERLALKEIVATDSSQFVKIVETFLSQWATNDWLEDYKVERAGKWMWKLCSPSLVKDIERNVRKRACSDPAPRGRNATIYARTYGAFLKGIESRYITS